MTRRDAHIPTGPFADGVRDWQQWTKDLYAAAAEIAEATERR
jgi:hypothetical protein